MSLDDEIRLAERQAASGGDVEKIRLTRLQERASFERVGSGLLSLNGAGFSPCRLYRYWLTRTWDAKAAHLAVLGLNPSTADETLDDPTIRRCIAFAKKWSYGGLIMMNVFAWRATDPKDMKAAAEPIGSMNDEFLRVLTVGRKVLCAWGNHGDYLGRGEKVTKMLVDEGRDLVCLEITKTNQPKHPLYVKGDTVPRRFPCLAK